MSLKMISFCERCKPKQIFQNNLRPKYIHTSEIVHRKSIYKTEEAEKIRFYVFERYKKYLMYYESLLEKKFPHAMRVYRVFTDGAKDFFTDFKHFFTIYRSLTTSGKTVYDLNLKEIELYNKMPKDMLKVAPVLLISSFPFANYVMFPLAYVFPRQLLSSHFWTLQQKSEFSVLYLQDRLKRQRSVFRHLQARCDGLKEHQLHAKWLNILALLGSGLHPTADKILECKELFLSEPYGLKFIKSKHVKELLKLHGLRFGFFRRNRLREHAVILHAMDKAIVREGGVQNLPYDVLRTACLIRGLNPTTMKNEDMVEWLKQWICVSKKTDPKTLSLLLHCPILLGYNQPTNWMLIYARKI